MEYIDANNVPRNALLSQGYKSVGDWHSTAKSGEGDEGERAGRWQGKDKTECGLHEDYFKMKAQAKVGGSGVSYCQRWLNLVASSPRRMRNLKRPPLQRPTGNDKAVVYQDFSYGICTDMGKKGRKCAKHAREIHFEFDVRVNER